MQISGIPEAWFRPSHPASQDESAQADGSLSLVYRAAALVECSVNFRSLRAGLNHSEERRYTTWLPAAEMAVDWDTVAACVTDSTQISQLADDAIGYASPGYKTTRDDFDGYLAELIDQLVRQERLRIFFNPVFGLFSTPSESREAFLARLAEASLERVEPELRRLRARFELQVEQVREAQSLKGYRTGDANTERFILRKLQFFASENRLADMFSTLAGTVFGTTEPRREGDFRPDEAELREDLDRIEDEASEALHALYDEYLALANEYDIFEIGLQPSNIQVLRRMLLWVPVAQQSLGNAS